MRRKLVVCVSTLGRVHIKFVDYSDHRAKWGGQHFTATHELRTSTEQFYEMLKEHLVLGPGIEPDMKACDGCKASFYSEELMLERIPGAYRLLCSQCVGEAGDE